MEANRLASANKVCECRLTQFTPNSQKTFYRDARWFNLSKDDTHQMLFFLLASLSTFMTYSDVTFLLHSAVRLESYRTLQYSLQILQIHARTTEMDK